ncbi:hypothetical protein BH11MYX2_BH11MYX2_27510 [soil metagenome]
MRKGDAVESIDTYASALREATATLAASELRYRRLFESAKDGILILDAQSGKIDDVNPFLTELIGYSHDELVGTCLWDLGVFKDIAASQEAFCELQRHEFARFDNLPLQARNGRTIAVEFVSNVYLVEGVRVVQCNVRDITVRKAAEAALRLRDRAIQSVSEGIVLTDPSAHDNPIVYTSPAFTRLTGYTNEEAVGRNCRFLQGPKSDPATVTALRQALAANRPCTVELLNYRKDGTTFWNSLAVSMVTDDAGLVTHHVGVLSDVTERRSLQSQFLQSQKMEAVGRLAGGIAHDLNNILSVILSYAEMLEDNPTLDAPVHADLGEIRKAAARATALTRQLLAFSRQQQLVSKVLLLDDVVGGLEQMLKRLLGADIHLTLLPTTDGWTIKADPGQVEQVLLNLAVNARDAMPEGGELTIETENVVLDGRYVGEHHDVSPGPYVMLAVTDTGFGMDAETQANIFEPFFTTKGLGKGTGLGLATVFGIVKQSGGHMWVYSEPGSGTTFKVYFPRADGVPEPRVNPVPVSVAVATETILLVEDDDQVRAVAESVLRRAGYVVLVAPNAGEALLICEKHGARIHLLLTDVILPRMSGRHLAERLAPMRPEMKILFMSGYTDDSVLQHGILESGVAFLQKPFTPDGLTRKVHETLHVAPAVTPA